MNRSDTCRSRPLSLLSSAPTPGSLLQHPLTVLRVASNVAGLLFQDKSLPRLALLLGRGKEFETDLVKYPHVFASKGTPILAATTALTAATVESA